MPEEKQKGPGSKFLPKSTQVIFVGYSEIHKAYKCFDEEILKEIYSPHVKFDELNLTKDIRSVAYPKSFSEHLNPASVNLAPIAINGQPTMPPTPEQQQNPVMDVDESSPNDLADLDFKNLLISYWTLPELTCFMAMPQIDIAPSYAEAMRKKFTHEFDAAIKKEYRSLAENGVFSASIELPKEKHALGTVFVL